MSIQKVWEIGGALVITIPTTEAKIYGIEKGNYINVDWAELLKTKWTEEEQ